MLAGDSPLSRGSSAYQSAASDAEEDQEASWSVLAPRGRENQILHVKILNLLAPATGISSFIIIVVIVVVTMAEVMNK